MPALKILHRSSHFAGRVVVLDKPVVTLGRDPATCEVVFDEEADRVVSRQHARLVWQGATLLMEPFPGKVVLRDRVILNGPTGVRPGDVFELAGPGGPSVEVSFDLPAPPPTTSPADERFPFTDLDLRLPKATPVVSAADAEAPTARSLSPVKPPANVVVDKHEAVTAPDALAFSVPPRPEPTGQHTMMLSALDLQALGASTRYLPSVTPEASAAQQPGRRPALVLGAGVAVALLLVGGVVAWHAWSKADAERRAAERVERLKEAFKDIQRPPGLSDADWEVYARKEQAQRKARKTRSPAASVEQEAFVLPPEEAEQPVAPPAVDAVDPRDEARGQFATLRRLELDRLALGRDRSRQANDQRARLDAQAQALRASYDALATSLRGEAGAQQVAVLTAARHLGECDATLPAALVTQALAAARSLASQGKAELEARLATAKDNRFTPTIAAALGDQGLPLELFALPLRASGFDARKVGDAGARGIPKGMWQLSPQVASGQKLTVGPQATQAVYDEADDRHRYEKETKAAVKAARALYAGPAAGSALLVLAFWEDGDPQPLMAARARAGLSASDTDPSRVSLARLWEKNALGPHRQQAVDALATVAVTSFPKAFGLGFAPPVAHVEPEDRR